MIFCCHFCKRAKNKNKDIEMEYNDIVINYIDMYREDIHRAINGSNTPTSK
jgi:glutaredoxin